MRGENMVPAFDRVRRRTRHVVEVANGTWTNHRGDVLPQWHIESIHDHPEFANQRRDVLTATGLRTQVRGVTQ